MDIKLYSDSAYWFQTTLESEQYKFSIHWNSLESVWYLDIDGLSDTSTAFHGLKLVPFCNLLEAHGAAYLGELWLINLSGGFSEPDFDTISTDFVLYYEELA